ncbi:hypothetical protein Tco_0362964 [Tanacetum coccineum]
MGGRGVKEKNKDVAAKNGVSPFVTDEPVVKEKQSSLVDTSIPNFENTDLRSYPPLPTQGSTPTGNTPVVPVESIRAISERLANTTYGFFGKASGLPRYVGNILVWAKLPGVPIMVFSEDGLSGRSSYAKAMIELRADMELKDTIVVAMPKLTGEGFYTCTVRVEYEWKPPRYACWKIFGHIQEECPKNPGLGVAKNLKKHSQSPRGVPVGPKVGFKPTKEYRPVSKKSTTNTSGTKKKGVEPTKELGTNRGTSNLVSNGVNSNGSSFWNVKTSSTSTTPIINNIGKLEKLIIKGKITLVDDDGKPLKKVDYLGDHDSEDEVESIGNDMARSMASEKVGFDTKSLLEQWRDTYESGDYDEDPYNDDMFEGQDVPDKIQDIRDNLDIRVRGRRKK